MSFINFLELNNAEYGKYAKGILYVICEIITNIMLAIGTLIDVITGLFYKITGANYKGSGSEALVEEQDLLSKLFNENIISEFSLFMIIVSFSLMALFGMIAVVRQMYFSKDERKGMGDVIKNMVLGFIFLVALGPLSMFAISSISTVATGIVGAFGDKSNISLADMIFNSSFSGNAIEAYNAMYATEITSWKQMDNNFIFEILYGNNPSGITFYWYVYFLGAIVVVYNLVVMSFKLIKRIFSIIVLYLTAPIYVARMVDDGGVKFKEWKNKAVSELISVIGTVISFMIFISLVSVIDGIELVESAVSSTDPSILSPGIRALATEGTQAINETALLINNITKMLLLMAGTSVAKDSGELLGNAVKSADNNGELLEGIFDRLGTIKETTASSKSSESTSPRTRVITRTSTSTRKVINYTEPMDSSMSRGPMEGRNSGLSGNTYNTVTNNVNKVERHVNNIQNRSEFNVSGGSVTGARHGSYRGSGSSSSTSVLDRGFASYKQENDKIRSEWDFVKGANSASSRDIVNQFESASKELDASIGGGDPNKIRNSMSRYVEAYKEEEKLAKQSYSDFTGRSVQLSSDLSIKQQSELKKISDAYTKAQVDYTKTARKLGQVSDSNMSTSEALRLKERADKQREKLMEASSRANDFYNKQKRGE